MKIYDLKVSEKELNFLRLGITSLEKVPVTAQDTPGIMGDKVIDAVCLDLLREVLSDPPYIEGPDTPTKDSRLMDIVKHTLEDVKDSEIPDPRNEEQNIFAYSHKLGSIRIEVGEEHHNLIEVTLTIEPKGFELDWGEWLGPNRWKIFQLIEDLIWVAYQDGQNNDPADFTYSYDSDHMGDTLKFRVGCTDWFS